MEKGTLDCAGYGVYRANRQSGSDDWMRVHGQPYPEKIMTMKAMKGEERKRRDEDIVNSIDTGIMMYPWMC